MGNKSVQLFSFFWAKQTGDTEMVLHYLINSFCHNVKEYDSILTHISKCCDQPFVTTQSLTGQLVGVNHIDMGHILVAGEFLPCCSLVLKTLAREINGLNFGLSV